MAYGYNPGLDPLPPLTQREGEKMPNWAIPSALVALGLLGHGGLKLLESIAKKRPPVSPLTQIIKSDAPKMAK